MSEGVIYLILALTIAGLSVYMLNMQHQHHEQERKEWMRERKDLLDRIQAPTFAEYANKVVREKKVEQPKEEEQPRPQFVT